MSTELCFGQRYDSELGILEPWYTNPAMDRIKQINLSDKVVMEWGGGSSSLWWAMRCNAVYTIDHNKEWADRVVEMQYDHGVGSECNYVNTHEGDTSINKDLYVRAYQGVKFDICIVDGVHRYECAEYAVKVLKPEILIIDNHQQDYVFMCPSLDILLEGVKMERFIQPDHTDHSGNPWATAIFYLNEKA